MKNMLVQVDAETLRIAYAFQHSVTARSLASHDLLSAAAYILIQPNDEKGGITVVSTDGAAVAVQHDPTGQASEPCLISVIPEIKPHLSDQQSNRRYVIAKDDSIHVVEECGVAETMCKVEGQRVLSRADVHPNAGPTNPLAFPDWAGRLAKLADNGDWVAAGASGMTIRHMAIIGGLWGDWPDARDVRLAYDRKGGYVLATFPFRPSLVCLIANKQDPDFDPLPGARSIFEADDPAAGL